MSESNPEAQQNPDMRRDAPGPETGGQISELKVSGNLMTLDAGLFCIFQAPNSVAPDPSTGLPGVRVTRAPGLDSNPDAISISTFRPDGWLDGTGALVHVKNGPAQVLVTIYQSSRQSPETAPKLQVLRLNGGAMQAPAAPLPAQPAPATAPEPTGGVPDNAEIVAHVQRQGDIGGPLGDWVGTRGGGMWMEGFSVAPRNGIDPDDIEYQAVLGRGWLSPWVDGGKFCGSRGMALPLLGFKVRLKGEAAKTFTCTYAATFVDGSSVGPVAAGESCEAESLAPMEALTIELKPREGRQAGARAPRARSSARAARNS